MGDENENHLSLAICRISAKPLPPGHQCPTFREQQDGCMIEHDLCRSSRGEQGMKSPWGSFADHLAERMKAVGEIPRSSMGSSHRSENALRSIASL